jgi:hypothetical protein
MATPARRSIKETLNIGFDSDQAATINQGDYVALATGRKVVKVTSIADPLYVGRALTVRPETKEVVVVTRFKINRSQVAGEDVVMGQMVVGPDNKVYQLNLPTPARHDGTTTGPKTVTAATDDAIKFTLQNDASQTITLAAGVNRTFASIAAEINAAIVGNVVAEVDAAGNLNLVATELGRSIQIETVTHHAYTLLGWTAAFYYPGYGNYPVSARTGLVVVGGAKDANVEVLEY